MVSGLRIGKYYTINLIWYVFLCWFCRAEEGDKSVLQVMFQHDIATSAFEICNYFLLVWDVYCDLTPSPASPHTFCNTLVMRNARLELAISPKQHGSFPCKRSKKGFQGDVKPEHFTSFWLRGDLFHEGNNLAPGAQLCAPHISSPLDGSYAPKGHLWHHSRNFSCQRRCCAVKAFSGSIRVLSLFFQSQLT